MPAYFDSSVVVSLVVGDARAGAALDLWNADIERVGSVLLGIECTTVLRRMQMLGDEQRRQADERLAVALEEVTQKPVDDDVARLVHLTPALGGCRALDAVHLATALYFNTAAEGDLHVCTFDERMADVASRLGLKVYA